MHGYATINTIWTMMKLLFLAIRSFYHLLYTQLGPPLTISLWSESGLNLSKWRARSTIDV